MLLPLLHSLHSPAYNQPLLPSPLPCCAGTAACAARRPAAPSASGELQQRLYAGCCPTPIAQTNAAEWSRRHCCCQAVGAPIEVPALPTSFFSLLLQAAHPDRRPRCARWQLSEVCGGAGGGAEGAGGELAVLPLPLLKECYRRSPSCAVAAAAASAAGPNMSASACGNAVGPHS